ncbi:MAG: 6-phospho-3-hexuloisomerase [Erysipelotrichaceae bacterium]
MIYPNIIKSIVDEISNSIAINEKQVDTLYKAIDQAPHVFIIGAGRSLLMIKAFSMRLMHVGYQVFIVGEVTTPAIKKDDLLFIASGSGETIGLIDKAKRAKAIGAKVALISKNGNSTLGKLADMVIEIPIAITTQPGASLFEQTLLITLDSIILYIINKKNQDLDIVYQKHANLE